MSETLPFLHRLLSQGRHLQQLRCDREALSVLGRLAAFQDLPADVAEESHVRQAEIELRRRKHRRARRHLAAALEYSPENAHYHFLMATALNTRKQGRPRRAAAHYLQSLAADPNQPRCLAAYGLLSLKQGQVVDGLDRLRQAAAMAPDDVEVIGKLVRGLRLAERGDEALTVLRAARFRNPRDGRLHKLYNHFLFGGLRRRQMASRRLARNPDDAPMLLAFGRTTTATVAPSSEGKILRLDGATTVSGPHTPRRPARNADWKHG